MIIHDSVESASILIVDDQEANVALLAELLTRRGYADLRSTTDARQVVALFGERQPDLILLDLMMPHLSGFDVMEQLKPLTPPGDYLPILVLTADITPEVRRRALGGGAKDFLTKPLDFEEVALRVKNLLETRLLYLQLLGHNAVLEETVRQRTAQIAEREARLSAILSALPDLMFVQDAAGVFTDHHAPDPKDLLMPPQQFLGKPLAQVLPPDLVATLEPPRRAALATRQVQTAEYELRLPAGTEYFEARFAPSGDDQTVAIARNITQRRRADRFMTALNSAALAMQLALTKDEIFAVSSRELQKLEMDCVVFMVAEDGKVLIPRHLSYSPNALAVAEKLTGVRREEYRLIIDDSDFYRQVVRERRTCFSADVAEELKGILPRKLKRFAGAMVELLSIPQMICAPAIVGDDVIGVLSVQSRHLAEEDAPAVKVFAQEIAAAWHMADLYEQAQQEIVERTRAEEQVRCQLGRVAALHVIDSSISSNADLDRTMETMLQQVTEQLQVDAAVLLLLDPDTETLTYAAGRGFRRHAIEETSLQMGESQPWRAALERRLVSVPSLPESGRGFVRARLLADEDFIAYHAAPLIVKDQVVGVLEVFHRAPQEVDEEWLRFLEALAGQAAIAVENARLFEGLQRANADLTVAYDATIEGWAHALDLRDKETEGHSRRVTEMTERMARAMGIGDDEIVHIRRGALLHDIGKMGVPDGILLKPNPLTEDEWVLMRRHPRLAFDLLSPIEYLTPALDIPYCHHERWDGTGYPRALKGEEIPLAARLFAVVDVWDALLSERPYRPRWSAEKALDHMRSGAGTHFAAEAVDVFFRVASEMASRKSAKEAPA